MGSSALAENDLAAAFEVLLSSVPILHDMRVPVGKLNQPICNR